MQHTTLPIKTAKLLQNARQPSASIEVAIEHLDASGNWQPLETFDTDETMRKGAISANWLTLGLDGKLGQFRIVVTVLGGFEWVNNADCLELTLSFDEGWEVRKYRLLALKPGVIAHDLQKELRQAGIMEQMQTRAPEALRYVVDSIVTQHSTAKEEWLKASFRLDRINSSKLPSTVASSYTPTEQAQIRIDVVPCRFSFLQKRSIALDLRADDGARDRSRKGALSRGYTLETRLDFGNALSQVLPAPHSPKTERTGYEKYTFLFLYREKGRYVRYENVETIDQRRSRKPAKDNINRRSHAENQKPAARKPDAPEHDKEMRIPPNPGNILGTASTPQESPSTTSNNHLHQIVTSRRSTSQPALSNITHDQFPTLSSAKDIFGPPIASEHSLTLRSSSNRAPRPAPQSGIRTSLQPDSIGSSTETPQNLQSVDYNVSRHVATQRIHTPAQNTVHQSQPRAGDPLSSNAHSLCTEQLATSSKQIIELVKKSDDTSQRACQRQQEAREKLLEQLDSIRQKREDLVSSESELQNQIGKLEAELHELNLCDKIFGKEEAELVQALNQLPPLGHVQSSSKKQELCQRLIETAEELLEEDRKELREAEECIQKTQKRRRSVVSQNSIPTIHRGRKRRAAAQTSAKDSEGNGVEAEIMPSIPCAVSNE